jgi:endonuclease YncB( thermonuclease family)
VTRLKKILKDGLFLGAFLILASLIVAKIDLQEEALVTGPFFAIDGDTLAAGAERLRLAGIDAPEADQSCEDAKGEPWNCGDAAREALARFASAAEAECSGDARDRYGRLLVRCRLGETDINADLVRQGMAVAAGGYKAEEDAARNASRGIWAGSFESPRAWRASRGEVDDDETEEGLFARLRGLLPWP